MPESGKPTDVVLDPSQCVHIIDATKGTVECHVGPCRLDLAEKDRPVKFDGTDYERCYNIEDAIQSFPVATEGDYIVLMNPAKDKSHPTCGKVTGAVDLIIGRSVVIPGPASFPLWPGQVAQVIKGHQLRSNRYLIARVINEEDAQENWGKVVMTPNEPVTAPPVSSDGDEGESSERAPETPTAAAEVVRAEGLTMGKEIVIKGTDVSFFIPPTGVAVVPDAEREYVRDAVTLETVEYCVLRDEDGNKRYVRGPAVVFPEPTEQFVTTKGKDGKTSRKFRAVELSEISGIHVKVLADYGDKAHPLPDIDDELKTEWTEGKELFITGKYIRIYFPRPEHAIIKHGKNERHFAVEIPEGEARYILNRLTGAISTLKGPKMALLDPRKEVFVKRVLDQKTVALWFPGNTEAQEHNATLEQVRDQISKSQSKSGRSVMRSARSAALEALDDMSGQVVGTSLGGTVNFASDVGDIQTSYAESERAVDDFGGDEIRRKDTFTPPRTITLDTKYEGAVTVRVWTGFAIQAVSATGEREVVVGPLPRILNYDEMLEIASLSTSEEGQPKHFKTPKCTPYLRVKNNVVSDVVAAQTSDLIDVKIDVSYRVNFEGDKNKWFNVENYVGLLCERCRSILRGKIKRMSIREFMGDSVMLVRDALLGEKPIMQATPSDEEETPTLGERSGLMFHENDMHLYDIEVGATIIGDGTIAAEITKAQHAIVTNEIGLDQDRQQLGLTLARQDIQREVNEAVSKTELAKITQDRSLADAQAEKAGESDAHRLETEKRRLGLIQASEASADEEAKRSLARVEAQDAHQLDFERVKGEMDAESEAALAEAFKARIESIKPGLIAALQVHGDKVLTSEMVKHLGVASALTGEGVEGIFKKIMHGNVLGEILSGNGETGKGIASQALARAGLKSQIEK